MNLKIKKITPYFLALIILVVVFILIPIKQTKAQSATGSCYGTNGQPVAFDQSTCLGLANQGYTWKSASSSTTTQTGTTTQSSSTTTYCNYGTPGTSTGVEISDSNAECTNNNGIPSDSSGNPITSSTNSQTTNTTPTNNSSAFANLVASGPYVCGISSTSNVAGCFVQVFYYLFMIVPAFILWLSAYFFNVFVYVTLLGKLFSGSQFLPAAWATVRDLSNIFFILILLYIAIRLILGIDGHGSKKMIARVIIIALLINFSMFFTEVVIDSSNILALIFYNKINVGAKDSNGNIMVAHYDSATGEKDVAGGLTGAFNPANHLDTNFFQAAGNITSSIQPSVTSNGTNNNATATSAGPVPASILIGIMIVSGTVMTFAAYAFFVTGFSFLGRMIELFVLIIFSPFALMSFSVPLLEKIEYIGWDDWFKRLLTVSFMAPIFMFFVYFIFMLIGANLFGGLLTKPSNGVPSFIENVLQIFLPAMLILVLLLKATDFAKRVQENSEKW